MQAKDVIRRVTELSAPICEDAGVTLWDVEFEKEGAQYMLTVTIDREGGVEIDDCETVSRTLDPLLDAREFAAMPPYTLCVSSAGLARKLKKPAHFKAFTGHDVELRFYRPVEGAKQIVGALIGLEKDGAVTITVEGAPKTFAAADIADVRLDVKF